MKVKVVKQFKDRHTNLLHDTDKELDITKERFEEINSTAHGILVEEIKEAKKTTKKSTKKK